MLVERCAENPLITPADVVPSRSDYQVVGAFNAGATIYKDEVILLLRVAERPKDKADDEELAPILDPHTGRINPLRIKHSDPDLELLTRRRQSFPKRTTRPSAWKTRESAKLATNSILRIRS